MIRAVLGDRAADGGSWGVQSAGGLTHHPLPFFRDYRPSEIDVELVDRYRAHKLAEREEIREALAAGADLRDEHGNRIRPLSNRSINMTLTLLGAILETAVESSIWHQIRRAGDVGASRRPTSSRRS